MKPPFIRLAAVLLLTCAGQRLAAAFNESAPLFTRLAGTVAVPAEFTNRSLFVTVKINGHGPFRMLVDTGSSVAIVTPSVATAVDAHEIAEDAEPDESINALGGTVEVRRVLLHTVELGTVQFEGVVAGGKPVDGLLGFSVFSDLILALDFPGRRVLMSPNWPAGMPPVRAEMAMREPAEVPLVSARLQGRDFEIMIDSGSNHGLGISPDFAQSTQWKAEPRPGPLVQALGATGREYIGRLAGELHLDRVTQDNPIAAVVDGAPSLGVEFLKNFCVVFDQGHDKVWFCSDSDRAVPAPTVRSFGLSLRADAGGWRVAGTIPGSPAEGAAIAKGDLVTEIESEPASNWTKDRIDGWTDTHEKVVLRVARSDQCRELALPVWQLVP
jgi:hypothetical protein